MPKQKRVNKSKEEIAAQLQHKQMIERQKSLAKLIFPYIADLPSVYDAQTACNAVAGFIKLGSKEAEDKLKVSDLEIVTTTSEKGLVLDAVNNILGLVEIENAKETASLLERMGSMLPQFLANKHLKDPMSVIKSEEFIA